jgi:hypothetical protein
MQSELSVVERWFLSHWDDLAVRVIVILVAGVILACVGAVRRFIFAVWKKIWGKVKETVLDPRVVPAGTVSVRLYLLSVLLLALAVFCVSFWSWKLERDTRRLKAEMIRYVLPRQLSKEQIETFGKYLSSHSQPHEVEIRYIVGDAEAQSYANDFSAAFKAGNWVPKMSPIDPAAITCKAIPQVSSHSPAGAEGDSALRWSIANQVAQDQGTRVEVDAAHQFLCRSQLKQMKNITEGVQIEQTGPFRPPPKTLDEKLHQYEDVWQCMNGALKEAGIQKVSAGYMLNNDPLETTTVFIGSRPRDKWAVVPPNFNSHQQVPQDITDDDF